MNFRKLYKCAREMVLILNYSNLTKNKNKSFLTDIALPTVVLYIYSFEMLKE